jgi:electron transfer flavoprotein alpha subunit
MLINETTKNDYKNVWVMAEVFEGKVQKVTLELLGKARELADARKSEVWCILIGCDVKNEVPDLFHHQADKVLIVDDKRFIHFIDETESSVLVRLIEKYKPEIILTGATSRGRSLIPRVAVLTNSGLTADCTGLAIDEESGLLLQTRPAFGGNLMATIKSENHRPQMSTVRPRVFTISEPDTSRTGEVIEETLLDSEEAKFKKVIEVITDAGDTIKIADAQFIITGGRGVKGPEGFEPLFDLAKLINAAVGASRAAVDAGWAPYSRQVGQTGQTVQPKVYMACGVSGQIQHLVGMQSADFIIGINKDIEAPMMMLADVAIVGDLFEVIPAIIKEIKKT